MTFFQLPYNDLGFSEDEWTDMSRGDKCIIRDYVLNGRNQTRTVIYNDYETDFQVRRVIGKYDMENRPQVQLSFTQFTFY